MEDRIRRALMNVRKQHYPLTEALESSTIDSEQIQELMGDFWIPSEILEETCERIRSSSIDDPAPPSPPEENALHELSMECGIEIPDIIKSLTTLKEGLDVKITEIREIETELKECEDIINHYNSTINIFKQNMSEMPFIVSISGENMFLDSLNNTLFTNLQSRNIPTKLKRFQYLQSQIRAIWSIIRATGNLHKTVDNMPQCTICFATSVSNVLIPCGHMFCDKCLTNLSHENKCFTCRRKAQKIQKLYPL